MEWLIGHLINVDTSDLLLFFVVHWLCRVNLAMLRTLNRTRAIYVCVCWPGGLYCDSHLSIWCHRQLGLLELRKLKWYPISKHFNISKPNYNRSRMIQSFAGFRLTHWGLLDECTRLAVKGNGGIFTQCFESREQGTWVLRWSITCLAVRTLPCKNSHLAWGFPTAALATKRRVGGFVVGCKAVKVTECYEPLWPHVPVPFL